MFAKLAAAAGFVAVSAQAPPTPTFPVEWTATVSRTGRRNVSGPPRGRRLTLSSGMAIL